jgi:hypothetical protein
VVGATHGIEHLPIAIECIARGASELARVGILARINNIARPVAEPTNDADSSDGAAAAQLSGPGSTAPGDLLAALFARCVAAAVDAAPRSPTRGGIRGMCAGVVWVLGWG